MKIRVFDADQNPAIDQPARFLSKKQAARHVRSGHYQPIAIPDKPWLRAIQALKVEVKCRGRNLARELLRFDYDYPVFHFDPTLALLPSLRYPLKLAPHHPRRKWKTVRPSER